MMKTEALRELVEARASGLEGIANIGKRLRQAGLPAKELEELVAPMFGMALALNDAHRLLEIAFKALSVAHEIAEKIGQSRIGPANGRQK